MAKTNETELARLQRLYAAARQRKIRAINRQDYREVSAQGAKMDRYQRKMEQLTQKETQQ